MTSGNGHKTTLLAIAGVLITALASLTLLLVSNIYSNVMTQQQAIAAQHTAMQSEILTLRLTLTEHMAEQRARESREDRR
jgi:hypothetical protein